MMMLGVLDCEVAQSKCVKNLGLYNEVWYSQEMLSPPPAIHRTIVSQQPDGCFGWLRVSFAEAP